MITSRQHKTAGSSRRKEKFMNTERIIRTVRPSDAEELVNIYAPYVEHTAISFEYEVPTPDEFRGRIERTLKKYPYLAAEENGRILGYAYAGPFVGRAAYNWSAEMSIYVRRDAKGQGVGGRLYGAMEEILKEMNILNLNACIGYPETEDEYLTRNSVEFHAHMGYQWVGRFHNSGYKFGRWYDMVWMEKLIGTHTGNPAPVKAFPEVRGMFAGNLLRE